MSSIELDISLAIIAAAVMLIIAGFALFQASKDRLKKILEESTDTTNSVLTAKEAEELTDESNRKTIEAQFNDIMGYIKEECRNGNNRFTRFSLFPEVKEKLEELGYEVETIYDDPDEIITDSSKAHYIIKW